MIKNLLLLLGGLVVVYVGYSYVTKEQELNSSDNIITNPLVSPTLQTQPSQLYPMEATIPPRVDSADQPWYAGTRNFMGQVNSDVTDLGMTLSSDLMTYDTNAFWTSLEDKFTIH